MSETPPPSSMPLPRQPTRVLVVGAGAAGLAAAWHVQRSAPSRFQVTLVDSKETPGGHATTLKGIVDPASGHEIPPIDVGFMVFNDLTYPNMMELYRHIGVDAEASDMSLSVSVQDGAGSFVEWSSRRVALLSQWRNWLRRDFVRMLFDMLRFNSRVSKFLKVPIKDKEKILLRDFVREGGYSQAFVDFYLVPFVSAIWSCSNRQAMDFPAESLLRFIDNHRLAQLFDRPQWLTVKGRSSTYVEKLLGEFFSFGGELRLRETVASVRRNGGCVFARFVGRDVEEEFDVLVMAGHAPESLACLKDPSEEEADVLGDFEYAANEIYVHTDSRLMPETRSVWSSWNCLSKAEGGAKDQCQSPVCVTYWLNSLQNLPKSCPDVFVTLNPIVPVDPAKCLSQLQFSHPLFTSRSVSSQRRISEIQGKKGTWYCGAYTRYGFHEDAMASGFGVAREITGLPLPWEQSSTFLRATHTWHRGGLVNHLTKAAKALVEGSIDRVARRVVSAFLRRAISIGTLELVERDGSMISVGRKQDIPSKISIPGPRVFVLRRSFYRRVLLGGAVGFAEAFMAGDVDFANPEDLVRFFEVFIVNRDAKGVRLTGIGISRIREAFKWVSHILRRNTLSGSRSNIEAHYDLSNDLFATFLGGTWVYSCAVFESSSMSLDEAQHVKLDRIIDKAKIEAHHHVLEIGCGWGECSIRIAQRRGCRVTGITLSHEQLKLANERAKAAGVADRVTFLLCDYREVGGVFDRVVSVEMIEAVGHEFLPDWFAAVDRVLAKDGRLVLQAITMPEDRYEQYLASVDFIQMYIFPGGCCPSIMALMGGISSSKANLVLEHAENLSHHYATTLSRWRESFLDNIDQVRKLGFDEKFIRMWVYYLCYCEAGFGTRTLGLHQLVFSRVGNMSIISTCGRVGACG